MLSEKDSSPSELKLIISRLESAGLKVKLYGQLKRWDGESCYDRLGNAVEGKATIQDACVVHILDPKRSPRSENWVIDEQVARDTYEKFKDRRGHLYVAIAYKQGEPNVMVLQKAMWEKLARQHAEISRDSAQAFGDLFNPLSKHWSNKLFAVYGMLCALLLGLSMGQLVFGAISVWSFAGFWLAMAISFLAGGGMKGSLLVGTTSQAIAGSLLGIFLIGGSLWIVHTLMVVIVFMSLEIPNEIWVIVSAIMGFLGATKWDYFRWNVL